MDMHADKTARGWARFLDRIRKLWDMPPPKKPVPTKGFEPAVMRDFSVATPREVSSR